MGRPIARLGSLGLLALAGWSSAAPAPTDAPDILIVLTDDIGFGGPS